MANNKFVSQSVYNVSVNRNKIIDIACNDNMSKKEYKVFLMLLSQLSGYKAPEVVKSNNVDPYNFKKIDTKQIAEALDIKRKEVEAAVDALFDYGYLEEGSNESVSEGWRFTF
jgi:hypothetical protein